MRPADAPARVSELLDEARRAGVPRLDAQWLLADLLGRPSSWLLAHDDHAVAQDLVLRFRQGCQRRKAGEPLAYVLGHWTFCGLRLQVSPAVLIPRPETEGLIDWAIERLAADADSGCSPDVADLGTGSGAIALALASAWPAARVAATDRSAEALAIARANVRSLGLSAVELATGDWWQAVGERRFDLVLANPPYVAVADPHLAALGHEPRSALCAGADGLDDLRRIVADAPGHLRAGAWLLLEHGHDQGHAVRALLEQAGLVEAQTRQDLAGLDRFTGARAPGASRRPVAS